MEDLQIVENIKHKDVKTYEYIVGRYSKQMYYIAYNIMHLSCSKEDMEECVSDIFLKVWTEINAYDPGRGSFKTWILILTKYKALEYKRKRSKETVVNLDELQLEDGFKVEQKILADELQARIADVIQTFSHLDQELFLRRYYYDEKISQLTESMQMTRSAVDNRLLRCRKRIKEVLAYGL